MTNDWTRRDVLKTSAGCIASGVAGVSGMGARVASASAPARHLDDTGIERLAGQIMDTSPERIVDFAFEQLDQGVTENDLLAACYNAGARYHGHHSAYVAQPIQRVAQLVDPTDRLLPMFYYLSVLRFRSGWSRIRPIPDVSLPTPSQAESVFHAAMKEGDGESASRAMVALCRASSAEKAFGRLWMYAAERNAASGGHTAISVANTFRTMQATGWRCAETAAQFAVADSSRSPGNTGVHVDNRTRAERVSEFPGNWFEKPSDTGATSELISIYREGKPSSACSTTFGMLLRGEVSAASVWDAVFVTTAELIVRYQWVGQKMLAGHSVTCANALHFMYRTVKDKHVRLYALLEAVEWTTSFLNRERARPALRDFDLVKLAPVEFSENDALTDQIFSLLPPRRFASMSRIGFEDVDRAMQRTLSWAKNAGSYQPFLREALRLMCVKSTPEVHDFKFPMGLFENMSHASAHWRPYMLAASVHVLHGTEMEDSSIVAEAKERLG